ncbi:hypothetical protein GGS20DRAFT_116494 [Poronia punctata]|nr:hypothetical protein GGS20DRAFT_116494 [Poronia punctata]
MSYDWLAQQPLGYANPAELDFSLRIVYSDGKKSTSTNWFHVWTVWGYNDPPRTSSVTSGSGTILSSVKSDASQSQSETYTSTPSTHFRTETATLAGFAGQTRDSGHQSPSAGNNKSDDNDDTTGPGLSRGAIAGIVVGVLAGLGIFAGLVSLVLYYRRKSLGSANARRGEGADGHENDPNGDDGDVAGVSGLRSSYRKAELEAHDQEIKEIDENIKDVGHEHIEAGTEARVVEANSGQKAIYELQGDDFVQEADARPLPRELDSNARAELDAVGDFKERADSPR